VAIVFAVLSLIILFIAAFLPWWVMDVDMTVESRSGVATGEVHLEAKLDEASGEVVARNGATQYENMEGRLTGEEEDVGRTTSILLWLSIIILIIAIVLLIVMVAVSRSIPMSRYARPYRNFALLLTLIALIFLLMTPIYYALAWPNAVEEEGQKNIASSSEYDQFEQLINEIFDGSFMGSDTFSETIQQSSYVYPYGSNNIEINGESTWGPGMGWILAVVGFIFVFITLILIKVGGDQAIILSSTVPLMPQYGYGYQGPQAYQPPQPTPQPYPQSLSSPQRQSTLPTQVVCPTCGYIIPVQPQSLPHPITCPQCGTKGFIE
jgi:ABC-type multidrug transport system fused ATPase/permease subunit